jgi:hypothetical protein
MNYADIERVFQTEMEDKWTSTNVVAYDNASIPTVKEPWVRMTLIPSDSETGSLGPNPITFRNGLLSLQVFTPLESGSRVAQQLADDFLAIFEHQQYENTLFTYSGVATRIGDDGFGWYQLNVLLDFQAT